MKKIINSAQGFTLVEVMITMAVLAIALIGLVGANIAVRHASASASERSVAIQDASRVIEEMRNAANTSGLNTYKTDAMNAATAALTTAGSLPISYNEVISVAYGPSGTGAPLDVTVTVSWLERGVRPASASLRSFIAQRR